MNCSSFLPKLRGAGAHRPWLAYRSASPRYGRVGGCGAWLGVRLAGHTAGNAAAAAALACRLCYLEPAPTWPSQGCTQNSRRAAAVLRRRWQLSCADATLSTSPAAPHRRLARGPWRSRGLPALHSGSWPPPPLMLGAATTATQRRP